MNRSEDGASLNYDSSRKAMRGRLALQSTSCAMSWSHLIESDLTARAVARKTAFDGRNRTFRVRACTRAEATDLNANPD